MPTELESKLQVYADLTVRVGLNLQPGQRLIISAYGSPEYLAPMVRAAAASAYQVGSPFVDVVWADDQLDLIRFQHAPRDSFEEYPTWRVHGMLSCARRGDAMLSILGLEPGLFQGQDPELVALAHQTADRQRRALNEYKSRCAVNWCTVAAAVPGWAARVFPDLPPQEQQASLWRAIFDICRVDREDPVAAWQEHVRRLVTRCDYLTQKGYAALKFKAPGTDLTVGLPRGHLWHGGRVTTEAGLRFTPNLPTEEVSTLPHKGQVDGVVRSSMPLNLRGTLIEGFSLTFAEGRVVDVSADQGGALLRKLLDTDGGARCLGEVALVPHSSPISRSGLLFYNTLFDENAASHLALGNPYRLTLRGGNAMSDEEFASAGGNQSSVHVDFMVGSGEMDVDGITEGGGAEPVMRGGEWAFAV